MCLCGAQALRANARLLSEQLAVSHSKVTELEGVVSEVRAVGERLRRERDSAFTARATAAAACDALSTSLNKCEAQLRQAQSQADSATAVEAELREKVSRLERNNSTLNERVEEGKRALETVRGENEALSQQCDALQQELAQRAGM